MVPGNGVCAARTISCLSTHALSNIKRCGRRNQRERHAPPAARACLFMQGNAGPTMSRPAFTREGAPSGSGKRPQRLSWAQRCACAVRALALLGMRSPLYYCRRNNKKGPRSRGGTVPGGYLAKLDRLASLIKTSKARFSAALKSLLFQRLSSSQLHPY